MTTTTNLGVTLLEQAQAQKEVTINEALNAFDAMIFSTVADKDLTTPPASPATGDAYIVAAAATGAWTGKSANIAYFDQVWRFITPRTGARLWVADEAAFYLFNGTAWAILASSGDMTKATYDPANIAQQLVGTSATQTLTNKTINGATNILTVRAANDITGTLPVANGGTGQTTFSDGQLMIGNTATGGLSKTTLTAGSNVTITNGNGSITIAATSGGGGIPSPGATTTNAVVKWNSTTGVAVANSGVLIDASNNLSGVATLASGATTITAAATSALAVGATGATNSAFTVDTSTASSATGLLVKSAAAAGGLAVSVQSSGANENLTLNAKGTGTVSIGSVSTGAIALARATTITGSLTQTTGNSVFTAAASSSAATVRHAFTGAADTALTASTEAPGVYFNLGQTRQHATGALSLQRDFRITGSTHSAVAASTITDAAALSIDGPAAAGTNAAITNSHAIFIPTAALSTGVTNAYALSINAPTGATNNYAAQFNGIVGIGTAAPNASAQLEVASTTRAFLPPRMSTTQKAAIASPVAGMVVFDSTLARLNVYNGTVWDSLSSGGAASLTPMVCEGRMTLTTLTPVTTTDVTAAATLYFTPYRGNRIALYDGASTWNTLSFTELSLAVPAAANQMYDLFAYNNAGAVALEATAWTNDTTRATALTRQDGVYVRTGATTRRYLGSFRTIVSGQTEDSAANRYVWNYYNRALRTMTAYDNTVSWTYSTTVWRQANANSANQLNFVIGVSEDAVSASLMNSVRNSTATVRNVYSNIGLDATTVGSPPFAFAGSGVIGTSDVNLTNVGVGLVAAGRHYLTWLEYGAGVDTQTWSGGNARGLMGSLLA